MNVTLYNPYAANDFITARDGKDYRVDAQGVVSVPEELMPQFVSLGFTPNNYSGGGGGSGDVTGPNATAAGGVALYADATGKLLSFNASFGFSQNEGSTTVDVGLGDGAPAVSGFRLGIGSGNFVTFIANPGATALAQFVLPTETGLLARTADVDAATKSKPQITALAPIADPATATAEDCANAINAIIAALQA